MSHIMLLEKQVRKTKPEKEHPMERRVNLLKGATDLKYSQFQPIYELWCDYFSTLIGGADGTPDERMIKADYHGCLLIVSDSPCKNLIGRVGIVIHETRRTFQIITKDDRVLTLPKTGSSFQFALEGRVFTLFGDALAQKSFLRGKKMRNRTTVPHLLR
uniref:Ribonuclease P protein subunit p29 n=1 Tax=Steinernema glaseri TaxID=37863 RepID=A0A1I8A602_9BILA